MNKIEKQILKNQRAMLEVLWVKAPKLVEDDVYARMKETDELLNPLPETICPLRKQTKDAFSESSEVKRC